MFYVPAAFNM